MMNEPQMNTDERRFTWVFLLVCVIFLFPSFLFAQTAQSSPSMPSISGPSAPSMPSVSGLTTGSSFGGASSKPNTSMTPSSAATKQTSSTATTTKNTQGLSALNLSSLAANLLGTNQTTAAGAGGGTNDLLTALLGGGTAAGSTAGLANTTANATTNALLQQILTKLDELLKAQNAAPATIPLTATAVNTTKIPNENGRFLRFSVNGYNILDTCRTVYFSTKSPDGSFLVTGDRKYQSDGKTRDETFYILFRKTDHMNYEAAFSVSQDYLNPYSFLYQLSQKSPLIATQTGNLINLRTNDTTFKTDLLIDTQIK